MVTKAASLAETLVGDLERRIASGELPPGARLPSERELTDESSFSRTVVREAVARLAARGLVETRRGSGAYVAQNARYQAFQVTPEEMTDLEDVIKLLEMRMPLEAEMADLAARRRDKTDLAELHRLLEVMETSTDVELSAEADSAFHAAIARATRNDYYTRFMTFLGVRLVPRRALLLHDRPQSSHAAYAKAIHNDHRAILAAIEDQDSARARRAARSHMQKSIERHRRMLEE